MNIERLLPETDLEVYKVTGILSDSQVSLLIKLAAGKVPTGYRQDEIDTAIADIRKASVEVCQNIFELSDLQASPENKKWPWFDLTVGDSRSVDHSGTHQKADNQFVTEFFVQPTAVGGDILFKNSLPTDLINLAPGEMLVASRSDEHQFEITEIKSGDRFTLLTHIHP